MLGAVASVAGSVVGAMGASSEADAQAAARERQAQVREINAITRREQGAARADAKGDEHDDAIAAQDVAAAGNGVIAGAGSAADIARKSYQNKYLDLANIIHSHESEAINEENLARSDRAAAADIRKSGKIKAFSTILGGLASASKGVATQIA
jgi:hypothetical protein